MGPDQEIDVDNDRAVYRTAMQGVVLEHEYSSGHVMLSPMKGADYGTVPVAELRCYAKNFARWQRDVRAKLDIHIEPRPLYRSLWINDEDWISWEFRLPGAYFVGKAEWRRNRGIYFIDRGRIRTTWAVSEAWASELLRFCNVADQAQSEGDGLLAASIEMPPPA